MFIKNRSFKISFALTLIVVLIAACNLPLQSGINTPEVQITPNIIYTAAVQTVIAQLTSAAGTPGAASSPTSNGVVAAQSATPSVPAALTTVPPTPTSVPTQTPQPSPTSAQLTATPTLPPTPTSVSTDPKLSLGKPTFQDKFANNKYWAFSADQHTDMTIKDGKLVMTAFNPDQWDGWAITTQKTINFYIEMTATPQSCSGLDRYGLMLRAKQDGSVGYLFGFSCDGRFSFRKWDGTSYTKYVDWTNNSAILKGPNQTNRLGVKAEGNHFTLYANGVKLTDFTDSSYDQGYFGVFIGAANTTNFTVKCSEIDYWEIP
jgi:hypothetical protein